MARGITLTLLAVAALTIPSLVATSDRDMGMTFASAAHPGKAFVGTAEGVGDAISSPAPFTSTVSVGGAEPAILVDKLGRGILVGDHLGVSRSTDGGVTWTRVSVPWIPGNVFGNGLFDGWVFAQDDAGKIYTSTTNGVIVNVGTSINGGQSFQLAVSSYVADAGLVADRPWLVARNNGEIAMIWNEAGNFERCVYSTDGALTFTNRALPFLGSGLPIGGLPAFDSGGRLVFAGNGGIGGGASSVYRWNSNPCSTSVSHIDLPAHGDQLSTQIVTDSAGKYYVATPTANNDGMQIIGMNGLQTAGMKQLVVSPGTLKGNSFGTIAGRPGELAVAWYGTTTPGDFQTVGFNGQWNVYVARVKDFWTATPQIRIDQVTSTPNHVGDFCFLGTGCDTGNPGDRDLLDYFQITYDATGALHLAYGHDGATANAEVHYAKLPVWT